MTRSADIDKITFGVVTRGKGKIFFQMGAASDDPGCVWVSRAVIEGGTEVPSSVACGPDGEPVLVVPVLDRDFSVTVRQLCEAGGSVLAEGELPVRQRWCKRRSQANTFLKNPDADRIRNCDEAWRADDIHIGDVRIIGGGASDLVRFSVTQRIRDGRVPSYEVELVGLSGAPIKGVCPIVIGSAEYDSPDYPGVSHYRIVYSAPVLPALDRFFIWVRDAQRPGEGAFEYVWPELAGRLRADWRRLSCPARLDEGYHDWFCGHKATPLELRMQRRAQGNFKTRPKFSLIALLRCAPDEAFFGMAESVLAQTYDEYELVLVNCAPNDASLAKAAEALTVREGRVRMVCPEGDLGASGGVSAGVAAARGDFVAFLDPDVALEPDLLYWYVEGVNRYPETDLLYCDEDLLQDGRYTLPLFKPDWDPFLLESNNYLGVLLCARRALLEGLPGLDPSLDTANDYHWALVAGEGARNVYHARRVLCHRRVRDAAGSEGEGLRPGPCDAAREALARHFERLGLSAAVEPVKGVPGCFRPTVSPTGAPRVSVLMYGLDEHAVEQGIDDWLAKGAWHREDFLPVVPDVMDARLVPAAINAAASRACADYLLLADAHARPLSPDLAARLLGLAMREGVGAAAPRIVFPDGSTKSLGIISSELSVVCPIGRDVPGDFAGMPEVLSLVHQVTAVRGYCMMVPRAAFEQIGGIPADCAGMFWDVALCLQLREKGFSVVIDPALAVSSPLDAADITENGWESGFTWRTGECELMARFPYQYATPDHYYSPQLAQDGYYGLSR